ncbi:hypothetical protein [Jiangella alkaliphila]|uniref:Uncharacterized protein n=1 Tax=Jiangella alkaliphila TaxID=419479 RepID=A0A1H2KSD0_9ACTN|nr:hypothetical protein [Jiangella alkaliphila]SDU71569.1 hypothetical protein SAMN04488563_4206 [Jiangella alkaliphila]
MSTPDAPPPPPRPGPVTRFRHWHRTMSLSNRLALYALVLAAAGVVTPLVAAIWTGSQGPDLGLLVEQDNNGCTSVWTVPRESTALVDDIIANVDVRQLTRWERDGRIMHRETVKARVSIRGGETPVELRDLTITVLSRTDPVTGEQSEAQGCGGEDNPQDEPDFVVVDLDTLPVGTAVPIDYLQQSDQQAGARQLADDEGEQITLPRTIDAQDIYSFTLIGRSMTYDTEWQAEITWWDGEHLHTDLLNDDGAPFRVTAPG